MFKSQLKNIRVAEELEGVRKARIGRPKCGLTPEEQRPYADLPPIFWDRLLSMHDIFQYFHDLLSRLALRLSRLKKPRASETLGSS